jgi:hypothetical protein
MPADGLYCFLDRGPTPAGDSVTTTRVPVRIASVTAGANADKAPASFDDNEVTSWSNDGQLATGWIKYEFAQVASVSEVTLKLGAWRTRTYQIRVSVDDKVVSTYTTPQSLGYVTIAFSPTSGKHLKIELAGAAGERDAFGNIVELADPKNTATTGGQSRGKDTLEIVEIEIYEPVVRGAAKRLKE